MKHIHFMGIGGVGMAGLAFLLKRDGLHVTGCDRSATVRTQWLEAAGIPVALGHDAAHLNGVDEVVVTPAVPRSNPEYAAARAQSRVRYRGEVLAERVNARMGIAVCGTHGKTTTATFTAKLLRALGDDPSWCIGGETGRFPVAGDGRGPFVVEADESDGTLALYRARILVVTNMDYDHPEHFPTVESYRACYARAMAQATHVIRSESLDSADWPELSSLVPGVHNVANARAAIEVARFLGHSPDAIRAALPSVLAELPDRRFQRILPVSGSSDSNSIRVYTDYAHHPREISCALAMAAALRPRRLRVLFQPHRHSRTKALCGQFPEAFRGADEVVLIPVYPAFESPLLGGDIADLYRSFREAATVPRLLLARSADEAARHAILTATSGDLILLVGAGDIIQLVPRLAAALADPAAWFAARAALQVNRWIGAGSNTWKSDLATGEVYRRTSHPANRPGVSLGIPWMAGIPGTIGGWVKMNAGAFGHSISEVVRRVKVDGRWCSAEVCGFAYRHSDIEGEIQDVEFDLSGVDFSESAADYLARRKRFPAGTWGSVFRNPAPDRPAGRLLEAVGAKSLRVGGAYVWEEHANVIVAGPGATPSDVLALTRLMAAAVREKFHINLRPEIQGLVV